tara:strand:- start:344 stop:565 length:222 start_codon:yes stop_codon:yes gene_type:complete
MLDKATAKAVAECVAIINPKLMQGEGAIFTQSGLESMLQINHAFAMQTIQHLCENIHVCEDMVKELKKIKEGA